MKVCTNGYCFANERVPRGFGDWAFFFNNPNAPVEEAFWVRQSFYSEAKKKAVAEAKRRGNVHTVHVGS